MPSSRAPEIFGTVEITRDPKSGRIKPVQQTPFSGTPRPGDRLKVIDQDGNTRFMTFRTFQKKYKSSIKTRT